MPISPPLPLLPYTQSPLFTCRLAGNESQSLACRIITIVVRVCNSSEQEKSCHRKWAVELKLRHFASVTQDMLYSLAWGKDGREGIGLGGWLTGLGDSVQRQQHSQKRCVLDMCVCVCTRTPLLQYSLSGFRPQDIINSWFWRECIKSLAVIITLRD